MSLDDLDRIARFRAAFARRQAVRSPGFPGGFAVLDPDYSRSHEHNQLIVDGAAEPGALAAVADTFLAERSHRQITVLSDEHGAACAPVLTAAGYAHATELVMIHRGPRPAPAAPAERLGLADIRSAVERQNRAWMPGAEEETVRHLVDRRNARLRGADQVAFLAVRDADGEVGSWADLYRDPVAGIAQVEDLVTADAHTRRGYADTVLATALHTAAESDLFFLLADPEDWPTTWYARRGFVPAGRAHVFSRTA